MSESNVVTGAKATLLANAIPLGLLGYGSQQFCSASRMPGYIRSVAPCSRWLRALGGYVGILTGALAVYLAFTFLINEMTGKPSSPLANLAARE